MSKIFYFDCETTGLDSSKNGIIQIAFSLEIDGKVVEERDIRMKPFKGDIIDSAALEVNGVTIEQIKDFQEPEDAYLEILSVFDEYIDKYDKNDKFFPSGYNVDFDLNFFSAFWKKASKSKYGVGSYCNWRKLDPLPILYFLVERGDLKLENYKLVTVCKHFGIELDNAHDALSDIRATVELIKIVKEKFLN